MDTNSFLLRTLLADRTISEAQLNRALAAGGDVLEQLVTAGATTHRTIAITRARMCEYPFVDLPAFEIDHRNAQHLPRNVAERLGVFPLFVFDQSATIAMLDPLNLQAIDTVRQVLKRDIDPVVCDSHMLKGLIARAYSLSQARDSDGSGIADEKDLTTGDEPIVAAVNQILIAAVDQGASDVHINPDENTLHLRYRVDGTLRPLQGPPKSMHGGIVQRLKVMAKLDLTQTRKPQDGKFRFSHNNQHVDIRLSTLPTIHGENVVMRLLRSALTVGSISDLNMPQQMTTWYEEAIKKPHGMILVTGPTGSGKTTTLYTALAALNSPNRNIMTIEDPVEIRLPLIRQIQVNAEVGLTFAGALRSILRQDPNVVLVGEIRDEETAKIAVQAALTGHLVLSTLHTNDAIGSLPRLSAMGVPSYAVCNALLCVVAQRLARKVCTECAVSASIDADLLEQLGLTTQSTAAVRRGTGCPRCNNTGCMGRVGVFEMLRITPKVRKLIEGERPVHEIAKAAQVDGYRPMWCDGLDKVLGGLIPAEEMIHLRSEFAEEHSDDAAAESRRIAA